MCLTSLFKGLSQTSISSGRQQKSWCWACRPRWPWPTKLHSCNEQGAHASRLICFYCHGAPIRAVMPFNPPPSISLVNGGQDGGRKATVNSPGGDRGCLSTGVYLMDKTFWQRYIAVGDLYKLREIYSEISRTLASFPVLLILGYWWIWHCSKREWTNDTSIYHRSHSKTCLLMILAQSRAWRPNSHSYEPTELLL